MRRGWSALILLLAVGCEGSPSTAAITPSGLPSSSAAQSTSPGPPTAGVYAVVVTGVLRMDAPTYTVSIVAMDGGVRAQANATNPNVPLVPWQPLPLVSASTARVYYLDGNASTARAGCPSGPELKYVTPDGASGTGSCLPIGPGQRGVFAVSPDDVHIAASIFDPHTGMHLLVGPNAPSSVSWTESFATTAFSEWPVGWHAGNVVLGLGLVSGGQQLCAFCALLPAGFHVAGIGGARIADVCDGPMQAIGGPPTPVGVLCETYSNHYTVASPAIVHWDGSKTNIPSQPCGFRAGGPAALSPDGKLIASTRDPNDCGRGTRISLFDLTGPGRPTPAVTTTSPWFLWIDSGHLCYQTGDDQSSILEVATGTVTPIATPGLCVTALPGGLG